VLGYSGAWGRRSVLHRRFALAVIDLPEIQYVPIDHPAARQTPLLGNAPVAVLFAVFESGIGAALPKQCSAYL
jgi:hypothetical protein